MNKDDPLLYIVTAELPDDETAQRFIRWLKEGHMRALRKYGAVRTEIVQLDPSAEDKIEIECHYVFQSRSAYDNYVHGGGAEALRAEGRQLFATTQFSRRLGNLIEVTD